MIILIVHNKKNRENCEDSMMKVLIQALQRFF